MKGSLWLFQKFGETEILSKSCSIPKLPKIIYIEISMDRQSSKLRKEWKL